MRDFRIPPDDLDLVADLCNAPDASLGDAQNVCRAEPAHLRIYVGAWMLMGEGSTADARRAALRDALKLYEGCGVDLLNRKSKLTTDDIVAEVLQLLAHESEGNRAA